MNRPRASIRRLHTFDTTNLDTKFVDVENEAPESSEGTGVSDVDTLALESGFLDLDGG